MAELATAASIPEIAYLLSLIPNGPHETAGSIRAAIEEADDIIAVDTLACTRLVPYPNDHKFLILWWVWNGTERKAWQRTLLFVLEETVRRYGDSANNWEGSGEFSGMGQGAERRLHAQQAATAALPTLVATDGNVSGRLGMGIALMKAALLQ